MALSGSDRAHARGPGLDCKQYSGNEPTGWSVNTCNAHPWLSLGCADISIRDENSPSGFYTALFQCCPTRAGRVGASEKTCVPQAFGQTPCGRGGPVGCAACWNVTNLSICSAFCEGAGDNCRHASVDPGPDGASSCAKGTRGPNRIAIVYQ
jgi:hypothetical protein